MQKALQMEQKFARLPETAGVLFVSVQPQAVEEGHASEFFLRLGLARHLTEGTGKALVQQLLAEEMRSGLKIFAGIYRGVSGTCRDDGTPPARPTAA
jgi:hypothetical protein